MKFSLNRVTLLLLATIAFPPEGFSEKNILSTSSLKKAVTSLSEEEINQLSHVYFENAVKSFNELIKEYNYELIKRYYDNKSNVLRYTFYHGDSFTDMLHKHHDTFDVTPYLKRDMDSLRPSNWNTLTLDEKKIALQRIDNSLQEEKRKVLLEIFRHYKSNTPFPGKYQNIRVLTDTEYKDLWELRSKNDDDNKNILIYQKELEHVYNNTYAKTVVEKYKKKEALLLHESLVNLAFTAIFQKESGLVKKDMHAISSFIAEIKKEGRNAFDFTSYLKNFEVNTASIKDLYTLRNIYLNRDGYYLNELFEQKRSRLINTHKRLYDLYQACKGKLKGNLIVGHVKRNKAAKAVSNQRDIDGQEGILSKQQPLSQERLVEQMPKTKPDASKSIPNEEMKTVPFSEFKVTSKNSYPKKMNAPAMLNRTGDLPSLEKSARDESATNHSNTTTKPQSYGFQKWNMSPVKESEQNRSDQEKTSAMVFQNGVSNKKNAPLIEVKNQPGSFGEKPVSEKTTNLTTVNHANLKRFMKILKEGEAIKIAMRESRYGAPFAGAVGNLFMVRLIATEIAENGLTPEMIVVIFANESLKNRFVDVIGGMKDASGQINTASILKYVFSNVQPLEWLSSAKNTLNSILTGTYTTVTEGVSNVAGTVASGVKKGTSAVYNTVASGVSSTTSGIGKAYTGVKNAVGKEWNYLKSLW